MNGISFEAVVALDGSGSHEFHSYFGLAPGMDERLPLARAPFSETGRLYDRMVSFGLWYHDGTVINSDGRRFGCYCSWRKAVNAEQGSADRDGCDTGVAAQIKSGCNAGRCGGTGGEQHSSPDGDDPPGSPSAPPCHLAQTDPQEFLEGGAA